jgi:hypothetical protein
MIRPKGIILPQDYHTEGVSSPEKRFCHPNCHRASILVETSSEEEHSHGQLRNKERKKEVSPVVERVSGLLVFSKRAALLRQSPDKTVLPLL